MARPSASVSRFGASGSMAHTPDVDPVRTPIMAFGQRNHHVLICFSSVVAL
ncbi:hypothetical protein [Nitrobacter sp.]|uniref:hypothetical protein n=1 Tax=Nitrobacter sp. TaxID=29420 RepID=UPI003220A160